MPKDHASSPSAIHLGQGAAGPLRLDVPALIDTRQVITASSGGGKSWLLRRIIELIARQVQVIVIDPEGEFATLRERFDMLLVGRDGEISAETRTARRLAVKLAELRVSAVIDLYDLGDWDARRAFLAPFLDGLMSIPKSAYHPIYVPIDEAHQFAPEKAAGRRDSAVAQSRRAVNFLMSAGRKRAICGALATQRISKLDKDAIGDAKNVFIGGITLDVDQQRAGDMLGLGKADRLALRDLEPGEFYCYGPAVGRGVHLFRVDPVITTHPRPGQRHLIEVPPASAAVQKIVAGLADLPRQVQAEADEQLALRQDLGQAQRRVAELERELKARPAAQPARIEVHIPVFKDGEVGRLEAAVQQMAAIAGEFGRLAEGIAGAGQSLRSGAGEVGEALRSVTARLPAPVLHQAQVRAPAPRPVEPSARVPRPQGGIGSEAQVWRPPTGIPKPQQSILNALAWIESVGIAPADKTQLALLAGASPRSSAYSNNLGALRSAGLIVYPAGGMVGLTDAGRAQAAAPSVAPTTQQLQDDILSRLPRPQAAILSVLIAAYPRPLPKADVAERAGASATSSAFSNNLGALRSLKLIDYPSPGQVVARPVLFLED